MAARRARIRPHRVRVQRGVADPAPGADFSKQRSGFSTCHRLPGLEGADRTGFRVPPARQADLGPLPGLVGLAAADAQPQAAGDDGDVLDMEGNKFGAAQRAGEAEQQQRAVAPAAGALIAGGEQLAQHVQRQRGGLAHRAAMRAQARPAAAPGYRGAPGSMAGR